MEKKRRWTKEEDKVLSDYVNLHKQHGKRDSHWNAIAKATGLDRSGKSCRSRWLDHLNPDLKKGPMSPEEEGLIIQLQATMGNKWAKIARHLPCRTDNEIKNFWNCMIKKKTQRRRIHAHVPLEPAPILDPPSMDNLLPSNPCPQHDFRLPQIVGHYFDRGGKLSVVTESMQRMGFLLPHSLLSVVHLPLHAPAPAPVQADPAPAPAEPEAAPDHHSEAPAPAPAAEDVEVPTSSWDSLLFDPNDLGPDIYLDIQGAPMDIFDSLPDDIDIE